MSDETDADDIFGDDDPTDDDAPESAPAISATGSTPAEPVPATKSPAPAAAGPDPNAELLQAALGTLKTEWAESAKAAGFAAANFEEIGLKGFTEAAKAQFMTEAKASHERRVKELEALGFHFDPTRSADEARKAAESAQDAAAKDQWGPAGPPTSATEGEIADQAVQDAVKAGDTMATIRSLKGLGDFVLKGGRR